MLSITKALSRLPQKQVKAVLWAGGNPFAYRQLLLFTPPGAGLPSLF